MRKTFVLCVLDGWGEGEESPFNAIVQAKTPCWDALNLSFKKSLLSASGADVGLPQGQMGNSEVGHTNIGAGRVVLQDLPRINQAIEKGALAQNETLKDFAQNLKTAGKACHLMGLLSPGGVHSHMDHLLALARILDGFGVRTHIHGFLDGRDTPPKSAQGFVKSFLEEIKNLSHVRLSSLGGRYYGMDRDNRWERIDQAINAIVKGDAKAFQDPLEAIQQSYDNGINDEFMVPLVLENYQGIQEGDGILVGNFRADRMRQILTRFVDMPPLATSDMLGMVSYSEDLDKRLKALFPAQCQAMTLGEIVSQKGLSQLRLAETEKYAHVTYFLNGGREAPFSGEERTMIASPKVATYDLQPEMSSRQVTTKLCEAIDGGTYDLIVVNYANADMVGHTGDLKAAIKAVEALDSALDQVWQTVQQQGAVLAITADHGNVESMVDAQSGKAHTAHTLNPVPFLLCAKEVFLLKPQGNLADIAPTLLDLMGLDKPTQMTGHSLRMT